MFAVFLVGLAAGTDVSSCSTTVLAADKKMYPGVAAERMTESAELVGQLDNSTLNGEWETLRKGLLTACGLRDLQSARPGSGYTGHCFNDFNHVDCCTMQGSQSNNENRGQVEGIAYSNQLGPGITVASTEMGDASSGSWCTCQLGAHKSPPADVCHKQFKAQLSFKLVWCPGPDGLTFNAFTIVDDAGGLLAHGEPTGRLPSSREREANWRAVKGSKYATPCTQIPS